MTRLIIRARLTDRPMMDMTSELHPTQPLPLPCGLTMKNRLILAPMTNCQSADDGRLSDEELRWLAMRAKGGFGMVMTCAVHVQAVGRGFPGQLGLYGEQHIEGHARIVDALHREECLAVVQLHHAGIRSPHELIEGAPVGPSPHLKSGSVGLSTDDTKRLRDDFIAAAHRAKRAGYDGVQIHGAHGYIIAQYLSARYNERQDEYGGSSENRARLLREIVAGTRSVCGGQFIVSVRLSPERFGMRWSEIKALSVALAASREIDLLDLSLWDVFKQAEGAGPDEPSLLDRVTRLDLTSVPLTVAGKIRTASDVRAVLSAGADCVSVGQSAILHHDFPRQVFADPNFAAVETPVTPSYLASQGLSPVFVLYMRRWKDFVTDSPRPMV